MKRNLEIIFTFIFGIVLGVVILGTYQAHTAPKLTEKPVPHIEYVYVEAEPEVITETEYIYVPYEEPFFRNLTEEDREALLDISMREAEGEDVIGQCWVMYTVICRAEAFGQSIKEVCDSSHFASSRSRSGLTPNENCCEALALIEEGWTPRPLNFRAGAYHDFRTPLCQYGNHYFSADM